MRLSGDEAVPGGLTVADMQVIVPRLVAAGRLDFVDISAGNDRHPVSNMLHHPPMGLPVAPYAGAARAIRAGLDVPVIHGTRIDSAAAAAALLASGAADFAGMCRALIADPHLPNKRRARPCRRRHALRRPANRPASAISNAASRSAAWAGGKPGGRRHGAGWSRRRRPGAVAVVGAGPAGMTAAAVAAERGHAVTLFERADQVGGLLLLAAMAQAGPNGGT